MRGRNLEISHSSLSELFLLELIMKCPMSGSNPPNGIAITSSLDSSFDSSSIGYCGFLTVLVSDATDFHLTFEGQGP